jgi:putative Ca2+/H+ antiporter (TMEM165/GDT1 family)
VAGPGFAEVFVVAATAQLAVLPGEKVQFIISGLSTRYNPLIVVAAAGSAFAGWTALEIGLGQALQGALPPLALDIIAAGFFLLFGLLLLRSAPARDSNPRATETDGGLGSVEQELSVLGFDLPERVATFVGIFAMMAVGEFGDKTQLVTISLATQYSAGAAIWAGEMAAIIPVSLANALFFYRFSHRFNLRKAHFIGAGIFLFFAADTVLSITTGYSVWEAAIGAVSSLLFALV